MTTLSNGTATVIPELVLGYATEQDTRTVVHRIIGRSGADYSLAPAGPRSGTLELLFAVEADADQARALHAAPAVWTLADADRPTLNMQYVVAGGSLGEVLEDQTRDMWIVAVPYSEVTA